ncbi:MAG: adenylyltransferase/cytidyltransferase family protein [Clostridium sp.]|nr:MAG: adenylyltransferase/cytidyltransferase family protein [Clostridium sp.]
MKIAVYVGSFNPVHKSHIKVVNLVLKNYVDKVIIVPTLAYWDKKNLIDIKDRINMLKFYERDNIIIDTKKIINVNIHIKFLREIQKAI